VENHSTFTRTLVQNLKPLNPLDIGEKVFKGGKNITKKVSGALGVKEDRKSRISLGPLFRKKDDASSRSSMDAPVSNSRRMSHDSSAGQQSNDELEGGVRDSGDESGDGNKEEVSMDELWDVENDVEIQGLSAMKLSPVLEPICQILLEVFDFKEKTSFLKRNSALILLKQWWGIKEGHTIET
jgi:hypothetical protein